MACQLQVSHCSLPHKKIYKQRQLSVTYSDIGQGDPVGGDAVSPPELPRDAPVSYSPHPVVPDLHVDVGDYLQLAAAHGFNGGLRHLVALYVPEMEAVCYFV